MNGYVVRTTGDQRGGNSWGPNSHVSSSPTKWHGLWLKLMILIKAGTSHSSKVLSLRQQCHCLREPPWPNCSDSSLCAQTHPLPTFQESRGHIKVDYLFSQCFLLAKHSDTALQTPLKFLVPWASSHSDGNLSSWNNLTCRNAFIYEDTKPSFFTLIKIWKQLYDPKEGAKLLTGFVSLDWILIT